MYVCAVFLPIIFVWQEAKQKQHVLLVRPAKRQKARSWKNLLERVSPANPLLVSRCTARSSAPRLYFTRGHNKLRFLSAYLFFIYFHVRVCEADIYLWLSCVAKPMQSEKRQWQPSKQFGKRLRLLYWFSHPFCVRLSPLFPGTSLSAASCVRWKFKLICIVWLSLLLPPALLYLCPP